MSSEADFDEFNSTLHVRRSGAMFWSRKSGSGYGDEGYCLPSDDYAGYSYCVPQVKYTDGTMKVYI